MIHKTKVYIYIYIHIYIQIYTYIYISIPDESSARFGLIVSWNAYAFIARCDLPFNGRAFERA